MKQPLSYLLLFTLSFFFTGFTPPEKEQFNVCIFLAEKCVISQYYTLQLRQLHEEFANENVRFIGVFSNPDATESGMNQFKEKYQLPFDLVLDKDQSQMNQFGVKVTPEVVVYNAKSSEVRYQGRIDNTYFKVGRRRQVTTTSELNDVLLALNRKKEIPISRTKAVGCLISKTNPILQNAVMCKPSGSK